MATPFAPGRRWRRGLTCLSALGLLAGCAGIAPAPDAGDAPDAKPVRDLPDVPLTADILYDVLVGEIAGQRGRLDVSVEALLQAALETRDPRLLERAARMGVYAKRFPDALKAARIWAELEPNDVTVHEVLGVLLVDAGQRAEAEVELNKMLDLAGADPGRAYWRLAEGLGRVRNLASALEVMEALTRRHPQQPEAYFAVAHLAARAKQPEQSLAAIEKALALRPGWEDAALFKAHQLASRNDAPALQRFYKEFLRSHPSARKVRLAYARLLLDNEQRDGAYAQFQKLVEYSPNEADALLAAGLLALQTNHLDEGEAYLKRALKLQPENDQVRLYLGQLAVERRQYDQAVEWLRQVQQDGYYFDAQLRLADVTARQGKLPEALDILRDLEPDSEKQHVQVVLSEEQILREAKQPQAAMEILDKALRALPDNGELLYARALLAVQLDRLDVHERDLRRLLAKDPKNAHALNALGYTLADQTNRHQEALKLLEQALALKPEDPFILDSMGWVQYRLGNHEAAIGYLKRALGKRPDAEIAAHLGEVLWISGDRAGAESVWNRALRDAPENDVLLGVIKKFKP